MKRYSLEELSFLLELPGPTLVAFIEREWIIAQSDFDEEDFARLRLILELRNELNVNDEGIDIILHLLDQIHALRRISHLQREDDGRERS